MEDTMKRDLDILIHLLNDIETKGKRNMSNLMMCIQIVEQLLAKANTEVKADVSA